MKRRESEEGRKAEKKRKKVGRLLVQQGSRGTAERYTVVLQELVLVYHES